MAKIIETTKDLEVWLRRAANAHHIYEQKLGHPDENWQGWYADFIFRRLDDTFVDHPQFTFTPLADQEPFGYS